jgi:hypothetical protein
MGKNFPTDFYVTCATVIPVLFLALVVQGGTYEAMLRTARRAAQTLPRRNRDYAAAELLPATAYLTFIAGVGGETLALFVLYRGSGDLATQEIVLITTLILLVVAVAVPGWKWWQVPQAVNNQHLRPARATRRTRPSDTGQGTGHCGMYATRTPNKSASPYEMQDVRNLASVKTDSLWRVVTLEIHF